MVLRMIEGPDDNFKDDRGTVNTDNSCPSYSLDELPALLPNLKAELPEEND